MDMSNDMTDFHNGTYVRNTINKSLSKLGISQNRAASCLALVSLACLGLGAPKIADAQETGGVLLQKNDLVYVGAFRVPQGGSTEEQTFNYGGTAVAFNPENNSLFLVGHSHKQRTAEISIPTLVNSRNIGDLNVASLIQPFADPVEGRLWDVNPTDSNDQRIGGQLVYNGKLYVSVYSYYDAQGTQSASHFSRPLDLSSRGQVTGPVRVGNTYPGWVSGYMTHIPAAWQADFGGPALTGNFGLAIAGIQSWGPSASVFDPEDIAGGSTVPATLLVGYPKDNSVLGGDWSTTNGFYNGTTRGDGIVFPEGTRSVLFFGLHGTGTFCYGNGSECGDPTDSDYGVHAYPYVYQVWAYDANDLLAVKRGEKSASSVVPYSVWNFNVPNELNDKHRIGGVAYDRTRGLLYFVQRFADSSAPIVHAFQINTGPRPVAPGNFQAK